MDHHNKANDLLDRYVSRQTTPEEDELIALWLMENTETNSAWQQMDDAAQAQWLTNTFSAITADIQSKKVFPERTIIRRLSWLGAAAALLLFALVWIFRPSPVKPELLTLQHVTAPAGSVKRLILPDGSRVWLNAASSLQYPAQFTKLREVYLSGEAFFDVVHNPAKAFIIHTGNVLTTVLGTAFNIREDKTLHTVEVTVARGKVSVADGRKLLAVLTPDKQLHYQVDSHVAEEKTIDSRRVSAWQQEDMEFKNIRFEEAVTQLEKRFGVKIRFADEELKEERFSGTVIRGQQLDEVLKIICTLNHVAYHQLTDGTILIDRQ